MFKFDIWIFDFFEILKGKIVFIIGFFLGLIYKGINDDGFEWSFIVLKNGEWLKLFNLFNF